MANKGKPKNIQDDVKKALEKLFGSRESFLGFQLILLSQTGQPLDVTFFHRQPIIDVKVHTKLFLAIAYGAGAAKLAELLNNIEFSDATVAALGEIWTIHPMPVTGLTQAKLDAVDLREAEEKQGPNGETLREMIRNTYKCTSREEEDKYLRRYIAS